MSTDQKFFIVKHVLDWFSLWPNYISRTDLPETEVPKGFKQVAPGDRWIAYAYTDNDNQNLPLRLVRGFCECVSPAKFNRETSEVKVDPDGWFIKGEPYGDQPKGRVEVKLGEFLGDYYKQQALVTITADQFEAIRKYALSQ